MVELQRSSDALESHRAVFCGAVLTLRCPGRVAKIKLVQSSQ